MAFTLGTKKHNFFSRYFVGMSWVANALISLLIEVQAH
jgi:hypothetical protein